MTLKEFRKNGFVTGRPFEVEGFEYWVERDRRGRYFNVIGTEKFVTRARPDTVCKMIEQDVIRRQQG